MKAAAGALCLLLMVFAWRVGADAHFSAPGPTPVITDRAGAFVTQAGHEADGRTEYGYWITPPPPRVVAMTLALEDGRFWQHPGVDPLAVARAAWSRVQGGRSGASTIAMQVARMQHPRPRTLWAKAIEAGTAVALTARYGRAAVLAQYLRLAPYGQGSHGIGHAAWWYFDKPASDLSWAEAALLAAIPQAPALAQPRRPSGLLRARARAGRALPAEHAAELASVRPGPIPVRPQGAMHAALRLTRMAAIADPAAPFLRSTIDLQRQASIARLMERDLRPWRRAGAEQAAVMVVRRDTNEVLVAIGSAGWHSRPGGQIDFTATPRSPGSTLKPFLYALALDRGLLRAQEVMEDVPERSFGVANADHDYLGKLLPRQALANSRNVPAVNLLRRIGIGPAFDWLRNAELHRLDGPADRFGLAMAIGALPTRLDRLMPAYGALANDGVLRPLVWWRGETPDARPVLSRNAARQVAQFLSDPMARLPSFPRYGASEYPFAVALKTGTSQGYRDAWTIAWSSDYLVGAWVGRADAGPMAGLSGARSAARLVQSVLLSLHGAGRADLRAGAVPVPAGQPMELCTATGQPGACAAQITEWLPTTQGAGVATESSLRITQPEPDQHVWRNPEAPAAFNRLVLRAAADASVQQVLWLVDGQPAGLAPPDQPFYWPMVPGRHRFEVRLPLQDTVSSAVRIMVE